MRSHDEWLKWHEESQKQTHYGENKRIPFGEDGAPARGKTCRFCTVKEGELHLVGCEEEVCSVCYGQVMHCSCNEEKI